MNASCGLCEQGIEDGYLCVVCSNATVVRLQELPSLHRGLAPFLAPAGGISHGRGTKPAYAPLPVNEDILDLRGPGGIVGVAEGWVSAIVRDRGIIRPTPVGGIEVRLSNAVDALLGYMPWVAVSWPDAGLFAVDIRDLTRSVASIIYPSAPTERGTRIGKCPAQFPEGPLCGAVLRLLPGERVVVCEWCGCSYPPAAWAGLKVLIDHDVAKAGPATPSEPTGPDAREGHPSHA